MNNMVMKNTLPSIGSLAIAAATTLGGCHDRQDTELYSRIVSFQNRVTDATAKLDKGKVTVSDDGYQISAINKDVSNKDGSFYFKTSTNNISVQQNLRSLDLKFGNGDNIGSSISGSCNLPNVVSMNISQFSLDASCLVEPAGRIFDEDLKCRINYHGSSTADNVEDARFRPELNALAKDLCILATRMGVNVYDRRTR